MALRGRRGHAVTSLAVAGLAVLSLANVAALGPGPAAPAACASGQRQDVAAVDAGPIVLDEPPPHRAYLQYEDDEPGPPPDVGHWTEVPPDGRDLPSDLDHLLLVDALEPTKGLRAAPVFAGDYAGTLRTLGVQLSRGHAIDAIPPQTTLAITIVVDGVALADNRFAVISESGRLDICHIAHLGMYHLLFTDLDVALAAHGIDNGPGVLHRLEFGFAPTGDDGAPLFEAFGIDTQSAASMLTFNGPPGPGPRHSLAGPGDDVR